MTVAERIDNSPVTTMIIGFAGIIYIVYWFAARGMDLTLDVMNFTLLMLGIILHGTPRNLLTAAEEGVRSERMSVFQIGLLSNKTMNMTFVVGLALQLAPLVISELAKAVRRLRRA